MENTAGIVDAHCHVTHIENVEHEIPDWKEKGVKAVITSALNIGDAEKSLLLAENYPGFVFVCAGLHPSGVDKLTAEQMNECMDFIKRNSKSTAGVGEVGLDYNWVTDEGKREISRDAFVQMIRLAHEIGKPLVIHTRNGTGKESAVSDALEILEENNAKRVMMHCFSGSEAELKKSLELGYFISFATNVCWTKKHPLLASKTPLERMLLETDAPWLDPDSTPQQRKLNNRPWKIARSAEVVAKMKGVSKERVLEITAANAGKLFGF